MDELMSSDLHCRVSGSDDMRVFLDLGSTPLADALVKPDKLDVPEDRFPLQVAFCPDSTLVQITEEVPEEKLFVDRKSTRLTPVT